MYKLLIILILSLFSCSEEKSNNISSKILTEEVKEDSKDSVIEECIDSCFSDELIKINHNIRLDMDNLKDISLIRWNDSSVIKFHQRNNILQNYNIGGYHPALQTKIYSFAEIPSLSLKMKNCVIFIEINHHYQACYLYVCNGRQNRTILLSELKEGMRYVYSDINKDGQIIRYSEDYFINKDDSKVSITLKKEDIIIGENSTNINLISSDFVIGKIELMKRQNYINLDKFISLPHSIVKNK